MAKKETSQSNGVATKVPKSRKIKAEVPAPSFRDMKREIESEVCAFRDMMLAKHGYRNGRDMRSHVAWYFEQYGLGISGEVEKEKRLAREKMIAEVVAKEQESHGLKKRRAV